jgi:hypothetical protein
MQASRLRPSDFGMKVRSHPDALLITARNKMRHSSELTRWLSISAQGFESPRLWATPHFIAGNYRSAVLAIERIVASGATAVTDRANPLWTGVDKSIVIDLLNSFVVHPLNVTFHPADIARFLEESSDRKLSSWDVVIPGGNGGGHNLADDVHVRLQGRKLLVNEERRFLLVNEKKLRVGSRGVEKEGMSSTEIRAAEAAFRAEEGNADAANVPDRAYRAHRSRPLLILHFLEGTVRREDGPFAVPPGTALTAIGLSFPSLGVDSHRVTYRINLVEIRNLVSDEDGESEDDDVEGD